MPGSNRRILVRLAVSSKPPSAVQHAVSDVEEELAARDHLQVVDSRWESDAGRFVVLLAEEEIGWDPQRVAEGMQEELFEITAAVVDDFRTYRCDIIDVQVVTDPGDAASRQGG